MQIGDLVWARWEKDCMGIVLDVVFDETDIEFSYRIKWVFQYPYESREYIEDLITKEEKCVEKRS